MHNFDLRNAHFDRLVNTPGLRWLGQNTNHATPHPAVIDAMMRCIRDEEFHIYAPPAGLEELRSGITNLLGLTGQSVMVSDGAVASLYHICHAFLKPGDEFISTDPTWNWPLAFARSIGAEVKQIPIYGDEHGYRLNPDRLAEVITDKTKLVYLVDPNNPLGTCCTPQEIAKISATVNQHDAILVHDCTYRDFAYQHTLAAHSDPNHTITTYSFSKWLGLAGLRVGATIAHPDIINLLAAAPPNNLGSNILSQRAAIAGLRIKSDWFPAVLQQQRDNQKIIKDTVDRISGLSIPVYPSNGNFIIIETFSARITPEALVAAFQERGVMIRQGGYHTPTFGNKFVKVSTSVPSSWVEEFAQLLPLMVERARESNQKPQLF